MFNQVRIFVTPWTVAHQAPLSMGFSRHKYWSGLPCSPPGDPPNPEMEPKSLSSPALAGGLFPTSTTCCLARKLQILELHNVSLHGFFALSPLHQCTPSMLKTASTHNSLFKDMAGEEG